MTQAITGIRDDELHALEARFTKPLRKLDQNGSASDRPRPRPTMSRRPSVFAATAIIAATGNAGRENRTITR